jgi:hypothetical protein
MTRILLLSALLLSSCTTPFGAKRAAPFKFGEKGDLVDFSYSWSAEASATPALEKRFRADLDRQWKEALKFALADRADAARGKRDFHGHLLAVDWLTAGRSKRLLSLEATVASFAGGAHPSHSSDALLWDRRDGAPVTVAALLGNPSSISALVQKRFCTLLDVERAKRRDATTEPGELFGDCPKLSEVTFVPADTNGNARFDRLRIIADPYVAGPYAEGYYRIDLPVTAAFVAALKPAYRSSFEVR